MTRFDYDTTRRERGLGDRKVPRYEECVFDVFNMPSESEAPSEYELFVPGAQMLYGSGKTNYWWKKLSPWRVEKWTPGSMASSVFVFVDDYQIAGRFAGARQALTDLEDDWDGEGSQGYSDADWDRVENFLVRHAKWLLFQKGIELPVPTISPASGGTIDLHWQERQFELLLNVPREHGTVVFYGDDYRIETIKGTFPFESTHTALMEWMGSRIELASRASPE